MSAAALFPTKKAAGRPRTSDKPRTGRALARYWFTLPDTCEHCGEAPAVDRHHIDGNPLNNIPANIAGLCRRCHMQADGRIGAPRAPRSHCKHGHKFTPENTYTHPATGKRVCRTCRRVRQSAEYRRARA